MTLLARKKNSSLLYIYRGMSFGFRFIHGPSSYFFIHTKLGNLIDPFLFMSYKNKYQPSSLFLFTYICIYLFSFFFFINELNTK